MPARPTHLPTDGFFRMRATVGKNARDFQPKGPPLNNLHDLTSIRAGQHVRKRVD
jgi:hypothetical protein